jgi:hypothetical protein
MGKNVSECSSIGNGEQREDLEDVDMRFDSPTIESPSIVMIEDAMRPMIVADDLEFSTGVEV